MLIINAALGRNGTITVTAILDTQLKINLPPQLWEQEVAALCLQALQGTGTGGLGAGKGPPPQSWEQEEKPSIAPSWEHFRHLGIYDFLFINAFGLYNFL